MANKFLTDINLNYNQLKLVKIDTYNANPTNAVEGQLIYVNAAGDKKLKFYNGTEWIAVGSGSVSEIVSVKYGGTGKDSIGANKMLIGKADGTYDEIGVDTEVTSESGNLITSGAVYTAVEAIKAMQFKGTVGASGVITSTDTNFNGKTITASLPFSAGYTFVATEAQSISGLGNLEVGDMILITSGDGTATTIDKCSPVVIQTNIDGAVTSNLTSATDAALCLFDGTTGHLIKASTLTDTDLTNIKDLYDDLKDQLFTLSSDSTADVVLTSSNTTATKVTKDDTLSATLSTKTDLTADTYGNNTTSTDKVTSFKVPKIEVDSKGRINTASDVTINVVGKKAVTQDSELQPNSGICTWNVTHGLNTVDVTVTVYDISGSELQVVYPEIDIATDSPNTVTIKFNATEAIAANTYKAVVVG